MKIEENIKKDELLKIFDENNCGYVADKNCLTDDDFLKVVAVENDEAVGYAVVYFCNDFLKREGFEVDIILEKDLLYIWQCVTKKGHEGKGVQSQIFKFISNKFKNLPMYSVVDKDNISSLKLHKKFGFGEVSTFDKNFHGRQCEFLVLKRSASN